MKEHTVICNHSRECKSEMYEECRHKIPHTVSEKAACVTTSCTRVKIIVKARCIPVTKEWDD